MTHALLDAPLFIPPDVIFRDLDGEAIILNLASGVYFGLNEVGSRVWAGLAESRTVRQIVEALTAQYEVEPGVLERDVLELVSQLVDRGLVEVPARGDRS